MKGKVGIRVGSVGWTVGWERKGKRKRKREKEKEKKKRGGRGKAARAARVKICAQGALFASIVSDFDSSLGGAFPGAGHPDRSVSL